MVPVVPIIILVSLLFFISQISSIAIVKSYFKIYSASFLITFHSPEIAMPINIHYYYYSYYN
jgi:hypothetical protein